MEVKPGYKQTEVGVIPEEWEVSTVGREFDVKLGKMLDAEKNVGVPKPYLGNRAVQWDRIDISELPTVRMTRADMDRFRLRKGDLLACEGGEVGRAAIWDAPIEECYYQKALHRLRPLRGFDVRLMVGLLRQWSDRGVLSNYVTQTSIAHLPREKFMEVPMPVPPPPEQRAIAEALSDVDGLLGGLDRLIAKKCDLKQAAMQQLLTGQTRLPGFQPKQSEFAKTVVGWFPADWKLSELSALVEPSRGIRYGIVQPGEYDPNGRYMIRGQDYSAVNGWAKPSEVFRVGPFVEERYRNARVKTGELIMTIVGYCGHVEVIPDWLDGANLTQTTARVAINLEKANSAFCKYMLLSPAGRNQVAANMKGAAQPGLNCGDIEKFLLPLPSIAEQTAIAEVLTEMDLELAALEQRREKTRALKQAMMQELLTGKTRLTAAHVPAA